jgi:diadenylate cyclase
VDKLLATMDDDLVWALQKIAPGTVLRQAIDNIVRARTGALLVFADEDQIAPLISGGIDIHVALKPMILYELAKMDGAILLNRAGTTRASTLKRRAPGIARRRGWPSNWECWLSRSRRRATS